MAAATVTESLPLSPDEAWAAASDLANFDRWMTIHAGWLSPLPDHLEKGSEVASRVTMKGFSNRIDWTVTRYDEPTRITLSGRGRGGVRISLDMTVRAAEPGCTVTMDASFTGGLLRGPVGSFIARAVQGDMHRSVQNLGSVSG